MEAGGFDYTKANFKDVVVIRREGNVMKNYKVNLKAALQGNENEPFYLKPDDIVYVPENIPCFDFGCPSLIFRPACFVASRVFF